MRSLVAAARFQLWHTRRKPGDAQALVVAPLFTIIFLAVVGEAGRADLLGHAVLAPALITVIGMSLFVAGEIIDEDRFLGLSGHSEEGVASSTPSLR